MQNIQTTESIAQLAEALGYKFSNAHYMDRMVARNLFEPEPNFTLNPFENIWTDLIKRFVTLDDVVRELKRLEMQKDKSKNC